MKPILFSTDMVKAILAGRKTQTRRLVKGPALEWLNDFVPEFVADPGNFLSPFGYPGDILYVRETYELLSAIPNEEKQYVYRASDDLPSPGSKWAPSIHMQKEAARIFLKVTNVRIERLHDITPNDIIDEGLGVPQKTESHELFTMFINLWDKLYGTGYFDLNPWVWVYEFEKIAKP